MKKNKIKIRTLFIIAFAIFFAIVIINQIQNQESQFKIVPHYYKDGKEISKSFFSLIIGNYTTYDFDQISFEIRATNTGDSFIDNIQITNASPIVFKNALPNIPQSLGIGESKMLWKSSKINASDLESSEPVVFNIFVNGQSTTETISRNTSISVVVKPKGVQFVYPSKIFNLSDQTYSGRSLASNDNYLWTIRYGNPQYIEKYTLNGDFLGTFKPQNSSNIYCLYSDNTYLWAVYSNPYQQNYVAQYRISDMVNISHTKIPMSNPSGIFATPNVMLIGDSKYIYQLTPNGTVSKNFSLGKTFRDITPYGSQFYVLHNYTEIRSYDSDWNYLNTYTIKDVIKKSYGITYQNNGFWISDANTNYRTISYFKID